MNNTALQETVIQENHPFSVGEILKAARLAQGFTLEQISKILRISLCQLSRLEENREDLMCDVYTLGFVKQYAQYLGLDVQELIQQLKNQAAHQPKSVPLIFPAPLPGRGIPSRAILLLCICGLLVIVIGWQWLNPSIPVAVLEVDLQEHEVPTPKVEQAIVPVKMAAQPIVPVKESVQAIELSVPVDEPPASETHLVASPTVDLQVTEEAWIQVKDQEGNVIVNRIFYPGESFEFKKTENLILTTGNLRGTHLSSGDKIFPIPTKSGQVGRNIPLNPEKWLEQPRGSELSSPQ